MRILLDRCVPKRFSLDFPDHDVTHASALPWGSEKNGQLVREAADHGFDVLFTVDSNMRHQTSLKGIQISVLVIDVPNNRLETLQSRTLEVRNSLLDLRPGTYKVVPWTEPSET